jgi:hypothetical protein
MNIRRFRLPLIALGIASAFEVVYEVANAYSLGALTSYLADDAPKVVQWLYWSPRVLGVRVANALGYRFDHVAYSAPWQFDAIVYAVSVPMTAGGVWLVLWLLALLRKRSIRTLKAT